MSFSISPHLILNLPCEFRRFAIADLVDPALVQRKLNSHNSDSALASRLARLADDADEQILREIVIALGRLKWMPNTEWWRHHLQWPDQAMAHAAMQTLRRCEDWSTVTKLLDEPDDSPIREIARKALADERMRQLLTD